MYMTDGILKLFKKSTEKKFLRMNNFEYSFDGKNPVRLYPEWEAAMKEPVFGYGVGAASNRWAPHNEYVAMWLELGLPGLLVYLLTLYSPALRSLMCGGKAGFAVLAVLLYSPIAQGRVMDAHFYFTLITTAHILWPQRFRLVARHQPDTARNATSALPASQPAQPWPRG